MRTVTVQHITGFKEKLGQQLDCLPFGMDQPLCSAAQGAYARLRLIRGWMGQSVCLCLVEARLHRELRLVCFD